MKASGLGLILSAALALSTTGCLKKILIDGQLRSTRQGSDAVSTVQDFEVGRSIATASLGQLEGLYGLAPNNPDGLFMLTKAWSGSASGFFEDDYELALEKKDDNLAEFNLTRMKAGFARARYYAVKMLTLNTSGFEEAKRNNETIRAWLVKNYTHKSEAEDLLWAGAAWLGEVQAGSDNPAIVSELYVGYNIVLRSVELDPEVSWGLGDTLLGAYHARTAMAELDDSKKHFDRALQINGGKYLLTKFYMAKRYYCFKTDKKAWERTMKEIAEAGDPLPEARLQNAIAKRKARRYMQHADVFQEDCGFLG
jgi:hypothetical protein